MVVSKTWKINFSELFTVKIHKIHVTDIYRHKSSFLDKIRIIQTVMNCHRIYFNGKFSLRSWKLTVNSYSFWYTSWSLKVFWNYPDLGKLSRYPDTVSRFHTFQQHILRIQWQNFLVEQNCFWQQKSNFCSQLLKSSASNCLVWFTLKRIFHTVKPALKITFTRLYHLPKMTTNFRST